MSGFQFTAACPHCNGPLEADLSTAGTDVSSGPSIVAYCRPCDAPWMLRATIEPTHACTVCGRGFASAHGLSTHLGNKHPDRYGVTVEPSEAPRPMVDWLPQAACRDLDTDLFIPPQEDSGRPLGPKSLARIDAAKAVCAGCPVAAECLADADAPTGWKDHSIRGGLTPQERFNVKRRRTRVAS